VISKSTIDRIVVMDFQHQKTIQENKMRGIKAEVLKIDWHYKLPPKIKVLEEVVTRGLVCYHLY
jgi:hypothetical protein